MFSSAVASWSMENENTQGRQARARAGPAREAGALPRFGSLHSLALPLWLPRPWLRCFTFNRTVWTAPGTEASGTSGSTWDESYLTRLPTTACEAWHNHLETRGKAPGEAASVFGSRGTAALCLSGI